jgi:hypothetical protein
LSAGHPFIDPPGMKRLAQAMSQPSEIFCAIASRMPAL